MTWRKIGLLIIFIPPGCPLWPGYSCKWKGISGNTERLVFRYSSFPTDLTFACNTFTSFSKIGDKTADIFHFKPRFLLFGESTFFRKAMGGLPSKFIQSSSSVFNTLSSVTNYIFRYREDHNASVIQLEMPKNDTFLLDIRRIWWMMLDTPKNYGVTVAEISRV